MSENTPEDLDLLIDLHKYNVRQGPGGRAETELAMYLASLGFDTHYKIADIGCGTGAASLVLAEMLDVNITAVDFLQDFLDTLNDRARDAELDDRIETLCASMDDLPFEDASLDLIWSEGAIYNIGFAKGVQDWRQYLKPGGVLVASEITWTTDERPQALEEYWEHAYPEIDTASNKIGVLERAGYQPLGYFILPEHCWIDNYYAPLADSYEAFLHRHKELAAAKKLIEAEKNEVTLYREYKDYYSYGVYIARKL